MRHDHVGITALLRPLLLAGFAAAMLSAAAPAEAQTRDAPLTSREQFVAATSGTREFLVDSGVTKVWLDVRQSSTSDSCAVSAPPAGQPLAAMTVVETLAAKADMSEVDALGMFSDAMSWASPQSGSYAITSAQPYIGMVLLEGGGRMDFWLEPLAADRTIPAGQPVSVYAALRDAGGGPVSAGAVTVAVEQAAASDGSAPQTPFVARLSLAAAADPGTYVATLTAGLPQQGVYTFSVEGRKDLLRRQLVTSFAATRTPLAAPAPASSSVALSAVEVQDVPSFEAAAASGPGTIYYYPEDAADLDKPVVVFVHGFHASANTWFGSDGFTRPALEANYRIAALELHPDESFTTNAAILADALPAIAAHYDVKKLVVVSHSKGGVDMDAAMLFHGMTDYVKSVITLATPHWGSPLADLADSDWISWLADIFGRRNEAQRSMKPGSMAQYRAQVADHPRNNFDYLDFRTICGWKFWNDPLAYYVLSGLYLKNHGGGRGNGGNDGVVNYKDSKRPVSTEIFNGESDSRTGVNHSQIHERGRYWHHIQAQLLTVYYDNSPSAPGDLAGVLEAASTPAAIRLTWTDRSRNETGFKLERSIDGGPFAQTSYILPGGFQQMWDTEVQPGHTYVYRLRAHINERWFSDYSNAVSVAYPVSPPAAPTQLAATALSPTSVRLTWRDNSNNETGFDVERRLAPSGAFVRIATVGANSTRMTDNGVQEYTRYEYRVLAVNAGGSSVSNVAAVTPPPPAPSALAAWFEIAARRVRLNWADNSNAEQGFQLQFSYSGSAFSDLSPPTVGPNVRSYAGGYNPPTGSYQFRVRSFANGLYSPWSEVAALIVVTPVSGYQGCYTDSATRALPAQLGGTTHTIESCKQAALSAGYLYAGVQWYGYCFAGNSLGYSLVTDDQCNTPCRSNQTQMCGGGWRNSIYATGYVPNRPPVAVDDFATTHCGRAVTVVVTANDSDPDGDPVALITSPVVVPAGNGTAVKLSGSSIQYTPNAGFLGNDSFQYEVGDGRGARARAWVTVSVTNNPPLARDDSATAHINTAVTVVVTANDSDPDGDAVTLIANPIIVAPTRGTAVKLSGSSIQYTPNAGFLGSDTFQYEVGDGCGGRSRAWVTVSVTNNPPVAVDDSASTRRNTALTIVVTANDYDPDGDAVTLIGSPIIVAPSRGTAVKVSGSSITYTPNTGVTGSDSFQYEIGDGNGRRARAWVTVTIKP